MRHFLDQYPPCRLTICCTGLPLLGAAASAQDLELSIGPDGPRLRYIRWSVATRTLKIATRRRTTSTGRSCAAARKDAR